MRVRIAWFMGGAAVASAMGIYALQQDYKNAHQSLSLQVPSFFLFNIHFVLVFLLFIFHFCEYLITDIFAQSVPLCVCPVSP